MHIPHIPYAESPTIESHIGEASEMHESTDAKEPTMSERKYRGFICGEEALRIPPTEPYCLHRPIRRGHLNISEHYPMQQVLCLIIFCYHWSSIISLICVFPLGGERYTGYPLSLPYIVWCYCICFDSKKINVDILIENASSAVSTIWVRHKLIMLCSKVQAKHVWWGFKLWLYIMTFLFLRLLRIFILFGIGFW